MRLALSIAATICATAAYAQAVPSFLEGTRLYSRDVGFCPGNPNPPATEGTLQVSKAGIYGYELGCTFLSLKPEKDPESGVIYSWQAQAQCGDDSGITRPDVFALYEDQAGSTIIVQSQNEYVLGTMLSITERPDDTDPFEQASWLSGTYTLCPTY